MQGEDPEEESLQQPELQELVQGDLRQRDTPSEKLDVTESEYVGWLLLEWAGARTRLEDLGLDIEMFLTTDGSLALAGGASPGGSALRSLLDLTFTYDTEPVLGLPGGTLHAGFQWIAGVNGSDRFGVLQAFSNIDAERRLQLGRLWYEQYFEETGTRLRVGKIDGNSLFAYVENGSQFIHSSMGFSPTIFLMPTYPDPAFGAAVLQGLAGGLELRGGVFDGSAAHGVRTGQRGPGPLFESPHDLFFIGEVDLGWGAGAPGRAGLGAWANTGDLERYDGGVEQGTSGAYALLDQRLWTRSNDGEERVDGFLQLGWADPAVSPFETHLGLGTIWNDPFAARGDYLGLGFTHVELSDAPGAGFTRDDETAIELFYGFEPVSWVRVKPDLQYVINPGGDAALDNAWIATLRLTVSL